MHVCSQKFGGVAQPQLFSMGMCAAVVLGSAAHPELRDCYFSA